MKKIKENYNLKSIKKINGITLIALVITIVVLIILASVAISMSLSNNGLFSIAKQAKVDYQTATNEEEEKVSTLSNSIDTITGNRGNVTIPEEEYTKLKNANKYSDGEIEIGEWIDGSTIYRKVIDLGYSFTIKNSVTKFTEGTMPSDMYLPIKSIFYVINDNQIDKGETPCEMFDDSGWSYKALDSWAATAQRHVYLMIEYTKK